MAAPQRRIVEDRHEVKLQRRLPDVRPWHEKFAEACTQKPLVVAISLPLLALACVFWLFAPIALGIVWWILALHKITVPILPMRYPAINPEPNPSTGKPGDGIMFFGNKDSTSPYEKFREIWGDDDNLRRHMLILGTTGSGKSETLKALFFNALCWSSGFFIADGKADNKLPTDVFTMVRSVGMDDNLLTLNFLLGGKTPEQVRRSRRRRTNKLNFVSSTDADTLIQIGANMLPKVEGEGKNWQEKALNLWRATVVALCYKRDTQGFDISVSTLVEYMNLSKIEELYIEGFKEAQQLGEWSHGFVGIKTYLDSGCPAYKVDKLLAKHGLDAGGAAGGMPGMPKPPSKPGANDQDTMASEQHAYRTSQLMPVLNLLDKTYGHIFRDRFSEIDMIDVTLNNRIMTMLIPSLEKSAQEAENLGKLAIACLRVMMARNLGGGVEGSRRELLESKATAAPYPYLVALDELGYYFSDGLAVIFAQARSLGFTMIPAAQDLEKLTEGSRAAEAGAMMANSGIKIFLRIVDPEKTWKLVNAVIGKAWVPMYRNYKIGGFGWKRETNVDLQEVDRVTMQDMDAMTPGEGFFTANGRATKFRSYYMDGDLRKHRADYFYVLRFLQVRAPTNDELDATSLPFDAINDPMVKAERLRSILSGDMELEGYGPEDLPQSDVIDAVAQKARSLGPHVPGHLRAMALFEAAAGALRSRARVGVDSNGSADGDEDPRDIPAADGQLHPARLGHQELAGGDGGSIDEAAWQDVAAQGAGSPGDMDQLTRLAAAVVAQEGTPGRNGSGQGLWSDEPSPLARGWGAPSAPHEPQDPVSSGASGTSGGADADIDLAALTAGLQTSDEQRTANHDRPAADAAGFDDAEDWDVIAPSAANAPNAPSTAVGRETPDNGSAAQAWADQESIDLDDLLSMDTPLVRKATQEVPPAQEVTAAAVSMAAGSLIDPVDVFLGTIVHFNMPAAAPHQTSAAAALGAAVLAPAGAEGDVRFDWELDDLLDAAGVTSAAPAANAHAASALAAMSEQTPASRVGLEDSALDNLTKLEAALGNPQPHSSARHVEALVSAHMSIPLDSAAKGTQQDVDDMLRELNDLCDFDPTGGSGSGNPGGDSK